MVLMSVGQHKSAYAVFVVYKIGRIRYNEIDSRHIGRRKRKTGVDNNYVFTVFEYGHVFPDFSYAA